MKQIVKLSDVAMIQVEGRQELNNKIIQGTKTAIKKYKKESNEGYDPNSIIDVACEYLESQGYMCDYISGDVTIEF